jgi:predicted transglutaminase-like cysteine proteinase
LSRIARRPKQIGEQIKRSDELVVEFWKRRGADLENTLQGFAQDLGQTAVKALYKPEGEQKSDPESVQKFTMNTDVPVVRVKQSLNTSVSMTQDAEAMSRAEHYQRISDLQDIASAEDLPKRRRPRRLPAPKTGTGSHCPKRTRTL